MIKKAIIKNMFGIRDFDVDFELKGLSQKMQLGDQVFIEKNKNDKSFYSLLPTFLAKNASGKTSFIKAVELTSRFLTEESLVTELTFFGRRLFKNAIDISTSTFVEQQSTSNASHVGGHNFVNIRRANMKTVDYMQLIEDMIAKMYNEEIAFIGETESYVRLELINNRSIAINYSAEDFKIIYDDAEIVSLKNILYTIMHNINTFDVSMAQGIFFENIKLWTEGVVYRLHTFSKDDKNPKIICIYNDTDRLSRQSQLKHITPQKIELIKNTYGFDALRTILTEADNNIADVKYNLSKKSLDIYMKHVDGLPLGVHQLSYGTLKLLEIFAISVELFNNGGALLVDEIENGLHLSLIKLLTEMYTNEEINIANAQLITTTHNPLLLEREIIEPRNVYMTESDDSTHSKFVNIKNIIGYDRPSDVDAFVKSKNYFNDIFWLKMGSAPKSTLTSPAIDFILQKLIEGSYHEQKRK